MFQAGSERKANDCCRHILHVQSPVLRAHGDHLEKRPSLVRSQEEPGRVQHQDWPYRHDSMHCNCHSRSWTFHLSGGRRMPLFPGSHLPFSY